MLRQAKDLDMVQERAEPSLGCRTKMGQKNAQRSLMEVSSRLAKQQDLNVDGESVQGQRQKGWVC